MKEFSGEFMRFDITKPQRSICFDDLFYTVPKVSYQSDYFSEIVESCIKKAESTLERRVSEQLEREIRAIKDTGNEYYICVIKAITDFSNEAGYPVSLLGEEAGMLIMYLIGTSNVHPEQIDYSVFSSEYSIDRLYKNNISFTLAIAEPIRVQLCSYLNERYGHINTSDEQCNQICLTESYSLELLKCLADLTVRENTNSSTGVNADVVASLYDKIYVELFDEKPFITANHTLKELRKLFAYSRCSHKHDKCITWFCDLDNYLFRDDFYDSFIKSGLRNDESVLLSSRGVWSQDKSRLVGYLEKKKVASDCVQCFDELTNLWSKATCMSRINILLTLEWYKINFPDEYEKVVRNIKL
ncbi:MAG: hypothetical protein MR567_07415 [Oscillospiraceae bacterium]|nr:hypothetical protein [Oscillospiraceae bacterium]